MLEELTIYFWNWYIWTQAVGNVRDCWMVGMWGLFWDNDDGLIMQKCFDMMGGTGAQFPYSYLSSYAQVAVINLDPIHQRNQEASV